MTGGTDDPMCPERREDIGKAVWAYLRLLDEIVPASQYSGVPPDEGTLNRIAAYGSIIECADARQQERERQGTKTKGGSDGDAA
ncbi:hypothetical protein ACGFNU_02040 [Spirillospora sp. NPDC048911]|uniref:hypothetical protein n=1 Tax=Spirillospora sp. NPDC048911 TaxID=3364527 RepID=UPI003717A86C